MSSSFVHRVPFDNPVNLKNGDKLQVTIDVFCKDSEVTIDKVNVFFDPIEGGAQIIEMSLAGHELDHTGMSGLDKDLAVKLGAQMAESIDRQILQSAQAVHDARSGASKFGDVVIMHPDVAADILGDPLLQRRLRKQIPAAQDMPGEEWDEI